MKTAAFLALLRRAHLTQAQAARVLQLTDRTMRRYVAGTSPVPRSVELALRFLAGDKNL